METTATETSLVSPKAGRLIGVVYLLYFVTAICAALRAKGIVVTNAAATAANLTAHASAFRASFTLGLVASVLYIALTALFYQLFRPVNRTLSFLAALFSLAGCEVQIFGSVFQLAPLVLLEHGQTLSGFTAAETPALVMLFLKLYGQSFNIAFVLFAFYDLLLGYLIWRADFLPRFFGFLLMLAGLGWLTYLWLPLATMLARFVQPFGFLAEALLMIWLLVKGVRAHVAPVS